MDLSVVGVILRVVFVLELGKDIFDGIFQQTAQRDFTVVKGIPKATLVGMICGAAAIAATVGSHCPPHPSIGVEWLAMPSHRLLLFHLSVRK